MRFSSRRYSITVQPALIHPSGKRDQEIKERVEGCRHLVAFIINGARPAQHRKFNEVQVFGPYGMAMPFCKATGS